MPKPWQVNALVQRLWEAHGHPGRYCVVGSLGIGSCALAEARENTEQEATDA
jgi:hypothetical protein